MSEADKNSSAENRRLDRVGLDVTRLMDGDTSPDKPDSRANPKHWIGRLLGRYEITDVLGMGGMGVVLRAHDSTIERDVAIKVLPADVSADETMLQRFLAEAKSAGKLNHPHIVTIYEIATDDKVHYLVMEFVTGGSVGDLQPTDGYSVADATRMTIEACKGLVVAHREGLVHRDVKPANLLLSEDGSVKVSDFGLAKKTCNDSLQMTQAGQILGTPYFMSPEQCESREVDARSDVYSLGATYYSLLTGQNPFQNSDSVMKVLFAHCNAERPNPLDVRANVPPACAKIVERAMAIDPNDRYQSGDEMRSDLEAVLAAISGLDIQLPSVPISSPGATKKNIPAQVDHSNRRKLPIASVAGIVAVIATAIAAFAIYNSWANISPAADNATNAKLAVAPPSGQPIKVGILHSLTGTMANCESPVVDAALLAIEELNDGGGVLGRPVEAVVADGRSHSSIFVEEARRLIEEEGVCVVFGCWTSASRKTIVPVVEELDHLLIYPLQYEGIEESPNVIYTGAAPNQQIIPAVKWAYAFENKRRFFLVGSDYVFPRVAHEIIKDQLAILGAELVGEAFLSLGSDDVQPVVDKIVAAQPDVILNCFNGDTNLSFFKSLRAAGITPQTVPTVSFSIGEAELSRLELSEMTGDFAAWNYFQSIDSPVNLKFVAAFHSKYGEGRAVTDPMESAWFGVKLWAQAVTDAGTTDKSAVRRALRNQRMEAPNGSVRIDPATQHTFKTPRIGQVRADGHFDIVWTGAKPEPPVPYPATRTTEQWRALLHDLYTGWGNEWSAPK